jgi:hypothetical protein
VGLAYLDQLMRDEALPSEQATSLYDALGRAAQVVEADARDRQLARELRDLGRNLPEASEDGVAAHRITALSEVIDGVARSLR